MSNIPSAILLHPNDDVLIARQQLLSGVLLPDGAVVSGLIPAGHKVTRRDIASGASVRRYGQIIGIATKPIHAGQHVRNIQWKTTHKAMSAITTCH